MHKLDIFSPPRVESSLYAAISAIGDDTDIEYDSSGEAMCSCKEIKIDEK